MAYLETIDASDRLDGTPKGLRMRQVPPETGRFLAILAAGAPPGQLLEIGTSAGYSGLWLSLACRQREQRLTTFEVDAEKVKLAGETFRLAGVEDVVQLVQGDARLRLADNALNHRDVLEPFIQHALSDDRVDGLVVPVGNGVLLCRKI